MDINFVCAMGPPGGGRNAITPRLTRHFNYLSFIEMDEVSKKRIFSKILGCWMGEYRVRAGEAMDKGRDPGQLPHHKDSRIALGRKKALSRQVQPQLSSFSRQLRLASS